MHTGRDLWTPDVMKYAEYTMDAEGQGQCPQEHWSPESKFGFCFVYEVWFHVAQVGLKFAT